MEAGVHQGRRKQRLLRPLTLVEDLFHRVLATKDQGHRQAKEAEVLQGRGKQQSLQQLTLMEDPFHKAPRALATRDPDLD